MAFIDGQALADSLQSGAAPELILLDLRENPFGSDAISDLVRSEKGVTIWNLSPQATADLQGPL